MGGGGYIRSKYSTSSAGLALSSKSSVIVYAGSEVRGPEVVLWVARNTGEYIVSQNRSEPYSMIGRYLKSQLTLPSLRARVYDIDTILWLASIKFYPR